jgi:Tol biopolymer transport system component
MEGRSRATVFEGPFPRILLAVAFAAILCIVSSGRAGGAGTLELISVATDGTAAGSSLGVSDITPDGRFVVFHSSATGLVEGEPNDCEFAGGECEDVYVRDRQLALTERVNVSSDEGEANDYASGGSISADGRFVAFSSLASNLVSGDTNAHEDVFLRDRLLGTTERVSLTDLELQAVGSSGSPVVSGDGRFVAFSSSAANLVSDDTNTTCTFPPAPENCYDVFVRDRQEGATLRVSVSTSGAQGDEASELTDMSPDGRFVVFSSRALNLAPDSALGDCFDPRDQPQDRCNQIFVRDTQLGVTTRASSAPDGISGNKDSFLGTISDDGGLLAFISWSSNLVEGDVATCPIDAGDLEIQVNCRDVFLRDLTTGDTAILSTGPIEEQGDRNSFEARISGDGRFVAFTSGATNLVPNPTTESCFTSCANLFVRDIISGKTVEGSPGSLGDVFGMPITTGGRFVAFSSASVQAGADENASQDAYLNDLGDADGDGEWDPFDNCPDTENLGQDDDDGDGIGDACDNCPTVFEFDQTDFDDDGIGNRCDNCGETPNADQIDTDSDEMGDACDIDDDADGVADESDNCPLVENPGQENSDKDPLGDACDNCPAASGLDQLDSDGDLAGDLCDRPGSGNSDCDGLINATDALKLLQYGAGLPVQQSEPCINIGAGLLAGAWAQGDVNCSGAVNSVDALLILRAVAGLPSIIPVGCPSIKP